MSAKPRAPLRLVVLDATDVGLGHFSPRAGTDGTSARGPGLSPIWRAGASLHRVLRAADATLAASSWQEALAWAVATSRAEARPIGSLQAWGHGGWGFMQLGASYLTTDSLRRSHALAPHVDALRETLAGPDALVWLRCCSAFGNDKGLAFAEALATRLGCRVAGHTHVIGFFQSGTHSVRPGEAPAWSAREGVRLKDGVPAEAETSSPGAPNTTWCLALDLPGGY